MTDASEVDWDDPQAVDQYNRIVKHVHDAWRIIVKQQFDLAYIGRFSYSDTDGMSPHERKVVYSMLVDQKNAEKEAMKAQATKSN